MGENSEGFPASKATTSETNLSTSSRPKPSSSAGGNNQIDGVYARKRRDLNVTPHAFVLFSNVSTSSPMDSTTAPLHDSTVVVSSTTELSLASDVNNAAVTNFTSDFTTSSEGIETSSPDNFSSFKTSAKTEGISTKVDGLNRTPDPDQLSQTTTEEPLKTASESVEEVLNKSAAIEQTFSEPTDVHEIEEILNSKIDYEKAFDPDYDDDDDSAETQTDGVIKIDKDVIEEMREKSPALPESISMKPSSVESPAAIQHDDPVYVYGQDEIEIVNVNHKTISTTAKSKAIYDHQEVPVKPEVKEFVSSKELTDFNLAAEELDAADMINIKSEMPVLKTHDINTTNADGVASETNKSSKISVIEVPKVVDSLIPSKRILVNVTIATEPDSPHSPQSIYVLSVSLPTEDTPSPEISVSSQSEKRYHNTSTHETSKNTDIHNDPKNYGGECECSCPCLDPETPSTSTSSNPDVTINKNITDFMSSTTETTILETSDSPTTEETWMTTTQCPEITTNAPPTPMILILEGRTLVLNKTNSD